MKYKSLASLVVAIVLAINVSFLIYVTIAQAQSNSRGVRTGIALPKARYATLTPNILKNGSVLLPILPRSMEVGAQAIALQNDYLDDNQQPQQSATTQGGNTPL